MKPMEEQDGPEYIITVKQSEKFQLCGMMAYYAILKSDEDEEDEAVAEFVQEAIKIIVHSLQDENHDSELDIDFAGIALIYHSCLTGIYLLDCAAGKDFLRAIGRLESPQKDVKAHIKEFKRVGHHFINDIDKRYGHVPEMASLRKQTEAQWSWLRKN